MNIEIVNSYVERLRAALGDAAAFAAVYVEMENDQAVRQPEAVGIAKSFYGDASSKLANPKRFAGLGAGRTPSWTIGQKQQRKQENLQLSGCAAELHFE